MDKVLCITTIPARLLDFDALSFDDRDFQAGESPLMLCRREMSWRASGLTIYERENPWV
jgi:hypothetical protein